MNEVLQEFLHLLIIICNSYKKELMHNLFFLVVLTVVIALIIENMS